MKGTSNSTVNLASIALEVPRVLLPRQGTDLTRWSVIACDQYTSQPGYWDAVKRFVGEAPSTLNLILPESHLDSIDRGEMADRISATMASYQRDGLLVEQERGFVLVDRETPHARSRKGLIVSLDLEHYEYARGAKSLIRATEGTVLDRLPARIDIRRRAPLEVSHIMALIDDPDKTVIEPLFSRELEKLYDFDLMMNSGRLKGYAIRDSRTLAEIAHRITRLTDPTRYQEKYQTPDTDILLYAVGDGNHSLATAKLLWEELKAAASDKSAIMRHPARYPLVEIVNLHDEGLVFEPIHRVVFSVSPGKLLHDFASISREQGSPFTFVPSSDPLKDLETVSRQKNSHCFPCISSEISGIALVSNPTKKLDVATLQSFLDTFIENTPGARIDYIHGDDALRELTSQPMSMGFFLNALPKHEFFHTIIHDGEFPRKTFSLGTAEEKRFYLECRAISP
ncbi:MAG TPA: DUF1015 domain-containing protein [Deltaproteobacteria bacterium]|nr:DUF1015 domain-containing protein [Deltaproteobacteria bacterium]